MLSDNYLLGEASRILPQVIPLGTADSCHILTIIATSGRVLLWPLKYPATGGSSIKPLIQPVNQVLNWAAEDNVYLQVIYFKF